MQCISEKEAITKWLEDGMDDVFEFEDYVNFLERTNIIVYRESTVKKEGKK
jgi:hypothetical protein